MNRRTLLALIGLAPVMPAVAKAAGPPLHCVERAPWKIHPVLAERNPIQLVWPVRWVSTEEMARTYPPT